MDGKNERLEFLVQCGVIAIIRADSSTQLVSAVGAIKKGGVKVIEVTMTTPSALEIVREVSGNFKDEVLIGVGSVLDSETARAAILSGAEFIVSPALNVELIKMCARYSKIVIPGALTPTEVITAWESGADLVKIFPVGSVGGPKYIKALKAPLPQVALVPTGGVSLENAGEFIRAGASAIAVGSNLVSNKIITEKKFGILTEIAQQFINTVKEAREQI